MVIILQKQKQTQECYHICFNYIDVLDFKVSNLINIIKAICWIRVVWDMGKNYNTKQYFKLNIFIQVEVV